MVKEIKETRKTRSPTVAGQFYPADETDLKEQVKKLLVNKKEEGIKAAVVPHAGYFFSGKLAGQVISKIPEKNCFILLGVNHSGFGNKASFSEKIFETPLGVVENNQKLVNKIIEKLKKADLDAEVNEQTHAYEHSIEVILPFLQLSQKKFEIVPLLLKDLSYEECKKIAVSVAEFVDNNICIIVSTDFTHYGFNYGFVPFSEDVRKNLYKLDKGIIQEILNLDSKAVYEKASKSTVCGFLGLTVLSEIATLKAWKGKLVDYYTSGDIVNDWGSAVGYGGVVFV